jgi:hypothetical protein
MVRKMDEHNETIEGKAEDAKACAVVVLDSGDAIYIEGVDSWPSDILGKRVIVTGVLKRKKLILDPVTGADGGISQGAWGKQTVLEGASWKLA